MAYNKTASSIADAVGMFMNRDKITNQGKKQGRIDALEDRRLAAQAGMFENQEGLGSLKIKALEKLSGPYGDAARAGQEHVDKFANAAQTFNETEKRNQAIKEFYNGNVNRANAIALFASGNSYTPFNNIGNTGFTYNSGTGKVMSGSRPGLNNTGLKLNPLALATLNNRNKEKEPTQTNIVKNLIAAGFKPGTPEFRQAIIKNLGNNNLANQKTRLDIELKQLEIEAQKNKSKEDEAAKKKKIDTAISNSDSILDEIDQIRRKTGVFSVETLGSVMGLVPGTDAYDIRRMVSTLQSNLAFDRLQEMRDASKTGGALGAISERELDLLQNSLVALDPNMDEDEFRRALDKIENHYKRAKLAMQGFDPDDSNSPSHAVDAQPAVELKDPMGIRGKIYK